jgi:hypothetical protein
MNIIVRAVQMSPHKGRGDINYVFFEQGKLSQPLFILTSIEMERLEAEMADAIQAEEDAA